MLHSQLPDWIHEGGPDAELERLRSTEARERVRGGVGSATPPTWERADRRLGAHGRQPLDGGPDPRRADRRVRQGRGRLRLRSAAGGETSAASHVSAAGRRRRPARALAHPYQMAGSDGIHLGSSVHPRTYGTYARVLQRYVREQGVLRLEEAIRKFSLVPGPAAEHRGSRPDPGGHVGRPRGLRRAGGDRARHL